MSRKRNSKRTATRSRARQIAKRANAPRSRRVLAALCLAFVLLASGGILASRRSFLLIGKPKQIQSQSAQVTPQSTTPSKQYIYAGGKVIATVEGASPTPTPPTAGIFLSAAASPSTVSLVWTYSGSGQQRFDIQRSTAGGSFLIVGTTNPTTFSFLDKIPPNGPAPGATYQYQVVAHSDLGGDSQPSNPVTVTIPTGPPSAPSNLIANYNASGPQVELSWTSTGNNQ